MFLYGSRLFISIADMCGYVYTPEVYPTSMRGIGLGACSGAARIGCMITPFVAMVSSVNENNNGVKWKTCQLSNETRKASFL